MKLSEKIQEALREQQEINLSDPAVQKQLAAQCGYVPAGSQLAPSVPKGFSREDLEAVADGLDGYEKTVNVGNVTGEGDDHLESTTAYAARFIRAMLAAAPEAKP